MNFLLDIALAGRFTLQNFKIYSKPTVIQRVSGKKTNRSMVQNSDSRYRYSQLFVLFKERHHHNSTGKEEPFLQMMLESLDNCAAKKIPPVLL